MMKTRMNGAMLLAVAVGVGACDGGGDDTNSLSSGTYTAFGATVNSDGCQLGVTAANINGSTLSLVVSGNTVTIGGTVELAIDGNDLAGGSEYTVDLNPDFDCILAATNTDLGTITANDQFALAEVISLQVQSGSGCAATGVSFPCSTGYSFSAEK